MRAPRERGVKAADLQSHRSHRRPASTAVFVPEVPAPEVPAQKRRYRKLGGLGAHCCRRTCCGSTCLPVSADLSGGAERKCRKKRRWRRRQRLRQFSDLWVRLEKRALGISDRDCCGPSAPGPCSGRAHLCRAAASSLWEVVASGACRSLWTLVFWVLVLAFQTETPLL
ncbi:Metalloprotease TIKI1 [Camelus dromedarius]|uniref:Metalloprotease TIKI1 n=1 Tax=Camelus dromedarius TaxID=9838 RepID=A0A5N4CDA7_CAMDR|nr:Metalloprotease TIKI1 [Camelus dromedarius]